MLSIIIVNYRSEQYLEKCLASIYQKSNSEQLEIIIVNNDQQVDLLEMKQKYPAIKLIKQENNVGFGRACNVGAGEAQGELLLFLNPDTQFLDDYASQIIAKFKANAQIGVVGPRLITDEGETQEWCAGKDVTIWRLIKNNLWIIESKKIWESTRATSVDWVSGAALVIKRDLFEKIGGFDKEFFMYGEDMDLCRQAKVLGYSIFYYPDIAVLHSGGKSRESWLKQKLQFYKSSAYYLIKKHKRGLKVQK